MNHIHIRCSDFVAEIGNLLDGNIDATLRADLEAHLAVCRACTVVYDSTQKTIRIVADANTFVLSASDLKTETESVMARIRAVRARS